MRVPEGYSLKSITLAREIKTLKAEGDRLRAKIP